MGTPRESQPVGAKVHSSRQWLPLVSFTLRLSSLHSDASNYTSLAPVVSGFRRGRPSRVSVTQSPRPSFLRAIAALRPSNLDPGAGVTSRYVCIICGGVCSLVNSCPSSRSFCGSLRCTQTPRISRVSRQLSPRLCLLLTPRMVAPLLLVVSGFVNR